MSKRVIVCNLCSKVDIDKLKNEIGDKNVKIGCVGACRKDKTQYFGKINGAYIYTQNEDEFIKECK